MKKLVAFVFFFSFTHIFPQVNSILEHKEPSKEELAWLKQHIHPIKTVDPKSSSDVDLEFLKPFVGNSKVLALGENTHGSSEIFKMKHRIIKYLAKNKEYDIFSIEGNMPEAYKLNGFIKNGIGNPIDLIRGMYFWTWKTQEVLDMVLWMKNYNKTAQKITFTGFDMQYYSGAIEELKIYFEKNSEIQNPIDSLKNILDEVNKKIRETRNRTISHKDNKKIETLMSEVLETINSIKSEETEWLLQNVTVIKQYLKNKKNFYLRDKYMAENLQWILSQNPESKIIIWAHNGHVKKAGNIKRMGEYLSDTLKTDYINIGFTFYQGEYTAISKEGLKTYKAEEAFAGTYEYFFNSINESIFFLDLKTIKEHNPKLGQWLLSRHLFRQVGAFKATKEFAQTNLAMDFDAIIFIKESTNSKMLD